MHDRDPNRETLTLQNREAEKALCLLMEQHKDRLYRFVLRRVGQACEAEDIAQQAFYEAVRTYDTFRGESQLSTWLYGIAANLVRNHLSRAPSRVYRFEDEGMLEDLQAADACPREQLEMTQLVRLLDQEMDGLMPEMRQALLMVAVDELSYQDAAEALSVPIGTVRSRVSRARAHLRRRFGEEGADLPF